MVLSYRSLEDSGVNSSVHEIQDNNKTTELRLATERSSVRSPLVLAAHVAEQLCKTHSLAFLLLCRRFLGDVL